MALRRTTKSKLYRYTVYAILIAVVVWLIVSTDWARIAQLYFNPEIAAKMVEGSLNKHRDGPILEWLVEDPVQLVAFVDQRCSRGVEVLRPGVVGVVAVGVTAADEPEDLPVGQDGEHDAVAEAVDESAGAGDGDQPGGGELLVGDAVASQMVGKGGPAGGGQAGSVVGVAGEVGAEPFGQVGLAPAAR